MKVLKKTDDYTVYQKRSGRYGVIDADKNPINGEDKVKILVAEGMVKQSVAAAPEPEVVEEPVAEEAVAEEAAAEEVAEEAAAEEPAAEEEPAPEVAEEPAAEEVSAEEEPETKE